MNFIFLLILIAVVGWIIWRARVKYRADINTSLDQAWRLVIKDPNYEHRRRYYEQLASSEKHKAEEDERVRKEEGL